MRLSTLGILLRSTEQIYIEPLSRVFLCLIDLRDIYIDSCDFAFRPRVCTRIVFLGYMCHSVMALFSLLSQNPLDIPEVPLRSISSRRYPAIVFSMH